MLVNKLLANMKIIASMAEGRRLIAQGAVKFNGQTVNLISEIDPKPGDTISLSRKTFTITENNDNL